MPADANRGAIMTIVNAIASVAVSNLASSARWYERLFGRAADSTPMPDLAEWKFERGGWLQVYESIERAGDCSATFAVINLDEQIALLRQCGIDPGPQMNSPMAKVVMILDPDGNSIAFAEALNPRVAQ